MMLSNSHSPSHKPNCLDAIHTGRCTAAWSYGGVCSAGLVCFQTRQGQLLLPLRQQTKWFAASTQLQLRMLNRWLMNDVCNRLSWVLQCCNNSNHSIVSYKTTPEHLSVLHMCKTLDVQGSWRLLKPRAPNNRQTYHPPAPPTVQQPPGGTTVRIFSRPARPVISPTRVNLAQLQGVPCQQAEWTTTHRRHMVICQA